MQQRILYHSTNRELEKGFRKRVSFREALFMGISPDMGLFMPDSIPRMSREEITSLRGKPYHEVAFEVLGRFLHGEFSDEDLREITREAYDFDVPLEKLDEHTFIARLDRGPTASFKDFAARLIARLMDSLKYPASEITILVATSGDTGSAIGEAYRGLEGINVYILYPRDEVSPVQKKQLDSIGRNVRAIAVEGKFDDCQKMVKAALSDPELKHLNLTSSNSINIGRVLAQVVYYFYSYVNVSQDFEPIVFSAPSGNFGNSLGCEIARRIGLPVKKLIVAVNENDEFPRFLDTGVYEKVEPSRKCLSNAMNVGNPSNLARYFDLYGGILDKDGVVHRPPNLDDMRNNIHSVSISDDETVRTIKEVYKERKLILDPHGAVGVAALKRYLLENGGALSVCIETADPAKFPEIIEKCISVKLKLPSSLEEIIKRDSHADSLPFDHSKFKGYLLKRAKGQ